MKTLITKEEYAALHVELQKCYKLNEETGSYELQLSDSGLNSALEAERKNAKSFRQQAAEMKKRIESLEKLGKTPEELADLVRAQEEAEQKALEEKGKYEQLKVQMIDNHKREIDKKDKEIGKLRKEIRKEKVNTVAAVYSSKAGVPAGPILDRLDRVAVMNDETLEIQLQEEGKVLFSRKDGNTGNPMGIEEYIIEYLPGNEDYARFYPPKGGTGGGSRPNQNQNMTPPGVRSVPRGDLVGKVNPEDIIKGTVVVAAEEK